MTSRVGLEFTSQLLIAGADTEMPGPLRIVSVLYQILHHGDCRTPSGQIPLMSHWQSTELVTLGKCADGTHGGRVAGDMTCFQGDRGGVCFP